MRVLVAVALVALSACTATTAKIDCAKFDEERRSAQFYLRITVSGALSHTSSVTDVGLRRTVAHLQAMSETVREAEPEAATYFERAVAVTRGGLDTKEKVREFGDLLAKGMDVMRASPCVRETP